MRKKISFALIILVIIAAIVSLILSPPRFQIGDEIIEGRYLDTAYEAYVDIDSRELDYDFDKDLLTVDVNNDFAIWISSSKEDEFMVSKMSLKDGKYCSLSNYAIINIKNCIGSEIEEHFTLGKENLLQYTITLASDYQSDKYKKSESFLYNNTLYVFAYNIVNYGD